MADDRPAGRLTRESGSRAPHGASGTRGAPAAARPGSVAAVVRWAVERLADAGVSSPEVDARQLVRAALGWSPMQLSVRLREPLSADHREAVAGLVARRAAREPLQLIVGSVGFRTITVDVARGVFIPRPETEVLVDLALDRLPSRGVAVEPCTGTGAVACAIAAERSDARVHASDIDPVAVRLAERNAVRNAVDIDVRVAALATAAPAGSAGCVDVLVCNPPYLADAELVDVEPEVAAWDPPAALVSGSTGHECTDQLIALAGDALRPGGWLVMELDPRRADDAARRAAAAGLSSATVHADLTGRARFVTARRPT